MLPGRQQVSSSWYGKKNSCRQQCNYLSTAKSLFVHNRAIIGPKKQLFFHSNAIICYFAIAMQSFSPYNATHLSTTMQQLKRYKIIAKLLVSRWVGAVWGAALHNQSRRSWFWSWPVFGERIGGIILVILYSDLDLRLRTIRTKVFSHKGSGNWPRTQLDSQIVDRMNEYYYQLDLVLIWLLKLNFFGLVLFLAWGKFIKLVPNSIQNICKFLVIFMKRTIPGFESRQEIGLLLFGGQQVSPS